MKNLVSRIGIMGELLAFLWHRKLWWLIPLMIITLLFGGLVVFAGSSPIAPFIYSLF